MDLREVYLDQDGVRTIWATVKVELSKKLNLSALDPYLRDDEVEAAILAALTEYPTKDQMIRAIADAIASVKTLQIKIVSLLPEVGEANVIYFVPAEDGAEPNLYNEYLWIDGRFEPIGSTSIDLSQYWSKTELTAMSLDTLREILV